MTLNQFLSNPNTRFKALSEMDKEYGPTWMHKSNHVSPEDMLETMSMYQGKRFYSGQVVCKLSSRSFTYGPLKVVVDINMLTTKGALKFDCQGTVIRPGMIVVKQWLIDRSWLSTGAPNDLLNEPGTIMRVLKVNNLHSYFHPNRISELTLNKDKIERFCVATELLNPYSGAFLSDTMNKWTDAFNDSIKLCAFESAYYLKVANQKERYAYYKRIWGCMVFDR